MKKSPLIFLFLFLFLGVLSFARTSQASYQYYRAITVTSTTSIASGTQSSFPMLVSTTLTSWESSSTGAGARIQNLCTAPNGVQEPCDLVFATSPANCTSSPLNFETESYTPSTGALVDWVNVPTLTAGTTIYACYGDATVTTDQSHPSLTWDSNYKGVYHLPNGTSLTANDSTGVNNGTLSNAPTATTGEIAGAANFVSASSQSITLGTSTSLSPAAITVSAWVKGTSFPGAYNTIWQKSPSTSIYTEMFIKSNGKVAVYVKNGSTANYDGTGVATLSAGTWYNVVFTYDNAGGGIKGYVNGSLDGTGLAIGALVNTTGTAVIGNDVITAGRFWNGVIDEVKISDTARSPSWILTEYNNESTPATFYAVGSEQTAVDVTAPTVPTGLSATGVSSSQVNLSWTASTDPDNASGVLVYGVYRGGTRIATTTAGTVTYSDTGRAASTTYAYTVLAQDPAGNTSAQSGSVNGTTLSGGGGSLTGTLDSTTLNTGIVSGVELNSFVWHGNLPGGTFFGLQFASSSSSGGPWNFTGPDGTSGTYYTTTPGVPFSLPYSMSGVRYFRYRVTLTSDSGQTLTPRVDDININWSQ